MADQPTRGYVVRAFDSNQECEDWLNEQADFYEPVSIADTNRYITVLAKRRPLYVVRHERSGETEASPLA